MKNSTIEKYGFRIRTRNGAIVENLSIGGRNESEAQRKLLQMYQGCEILDSCCLPATPLSRSGTANYEDVMNMITTN